MGLLDLFNENKRKWLSFAANAGTSANMNIIIQEFFVKDNIAVDKYMENQRANETTEGWNGGIEAWENLNSISISPEPPIKCTKTFRANYSEDRLNRAAGIPEWFYVAYPDVAFWFQSNLKKFERELESRNNELFGKDEIPRHFFRELIDRYKKEYGLLECC